MDYKTLMAKRAAAKAKRDALAAQKAKEEEEKAKETKTEEEKPVPKKKGRRPNNRVFMVVEDAPATEALAEETKEEETEEENLILGDSIVE